MHQRQVFVHVTVVASRNNISPSRVETPLHFTASFNVSRIEQGGCEPKTPPYVINRYAASPPNLPQTHAKASYGQCSGTCVLLGCRTHHSRATSGGFQRGHIPKNFSPSLRHEPVLWYIHGAMHGDPISGPGRCSSRIRHDTAFELDHVQSLVESRWSY